MIDYESKFVKMQFFIDITMTTINKKSEIDKIRILRDRDLLLKIRHQERLVLCLANNLGEK